nr:uncharacterized protein LOC123764767 isoform X2 [Procambarus clarkii]
MRDLEWTTMGPPPPPRRFGAFITPRKRGEIEEKGTPKRRRPDTFSESQFLREEPSGVEGDLLSLLAIDWGEDTPTRARPQDITLQEDELQIASLRLTEEQQALMTEIGPLDLGPSFTTWEGPLAPQPPSSPTIESVTKRLRLEGDTAEKGSADVGAVERELPRQTEQPLEEEELQIWPLPRPLLPEPPVSPVLAVTDTAPPQQPEMVVVPPVEKTPEQPTVPDDLLKKKGQLPEALEDQTLLEPQQPLLPSDSEPLRLGPLERGAPPRGRGRGHRRRLIIDRNIHITTADIRAQIQDYSSTMRRESSAEDVADVHGLRHKIPVGRLLSEVTHRRPLATSLAHMFASRYILQLPILDAPEAHPPVRRQLQLVDESVEEPLAGASVSSMDLGDASMFQLSHHESSKGSSSRSIHMTPKTAQLEVSVPPGLFQDTTQLLTIQEEQGVEMFPPPVLQEPGPPVALPGDVPLAVTPPAEVPPTEPSLAVTQATEVTLTVTTLTEVTLTVTRLTEVTPAELSLPLDAQQAERDLPRSMITSKPVPVRPPKPDQSGFEEIGLATPPGMLPKPPRVSSFVPPERTPERGPIRSPPGGATLVTLQADVHYHSPQKRTVNGVPLPTTQEFDVAEVVSPVGVEESVTGQVPAEGGTPRAPVGMPGPHSPPGPADISDTFIPSFISPIRQISPSSLKPHETEKALTDVLTRGAQVTLDSLLPPNPTRGEAAHMFSVLLEMHKKRLVRLDQEISFGPIYVTRL